MRRIYPNLTVNICVFHIFPYNPYENNFYKMSLVTLLRLPSQILTADMLIQFFTFSLCSTGDDG